MSSHLRLAGNELGVVCFVLLTSALSGCGSKEDLIIGSNDFVLLRRDEFDALDFDYWELATHSFDANYAWFTERNAKVAGGFLTLTISKEPAPAAPAPGEGQKPYSAAELRTRAPFLYGRFRARAKLAAGAGVVSAFWGFYDRYAMSSGLQMDNQIVIESVSGPEQLLRYAVVVPDAAPEANTTSPHVDLSQSAHEIGYDWTPTEVRFYLDGAVQSTFGMPASGQLEQYQRLVLSAYPSRADWVGDFDEASLPVAAEFDWVEIYEYAGPRP